MEHTDNRMGERLFDLAVLILVAPVLILGLVGIGALLLFAQGRPVFYRAQRMKTLDQCFTLYKFRTMRPCSGDAGVTGAHISERITPIGHWLRRTRLDELPQALNVLRGDIRLVGPRPPLAQCVQARPDLYGRVLRSTPGVTGLASVVFKDAEARLLAFCATAAETEAVYMARCAPRKAALDLIYQRNRSLWLDLFVIWRTALGLFGVVPRRRAYFRRGGPPL